jgi:NTP pyrophosphatase (non-canonical NTP hydrolase)
MSQKEVIAVQDANFEDWRKVPISRFVLGLCGEAGEVAEATKKYMRFLAGWKTGFITEVGLIRKLKEELPDVKIYLDMIAEYYNLDLEKLVRDKLEVDIKKFGWKRPEST